MIEAKVGTATLEEDQIERYRTIAKNAGVDCVVTISNQFTSSAQIHPMPAIRKSRSNIPVYYWSWMSILTTTDLLLSNDGVADADQTLLLNELRRFLSHESAEVKGFDKMPTEWTELNKLVAAGGRIPLKSSDASAVVAAWHQETRDLTLILTRQTEVLVSEVIPRKLASNGAARDKAAVETLSKENCLLATLNIPDAAAPIEIKADIVRRTIDVGMELKAPEDKVSTKARVNWLIRQVKTENTGDLNVRLLWLGRGEDTLFSFDQLREDPSIAEAGKEGQQVRRFEIFYARRLGARFTQQSNFIKDLEDVVPDFYREVGQGLTAWRKSAPRIKEDQAGSDDVAVDAIEDDAEEAIT